MRGLSEQALQVLHVIVSEAGETCMGDDDTCEEFPDNVTDDLVDRGCCVEFYCDVCGAEHFEPTLLGRVAVMLGSLK